MRTEFAALRSVPAYLRAIAFAIAFSGFLAISYLATAPTICHRRHAAAL